MNGARTTYMRRGYLLTALAAVVLLATSGTALAQVTITGPSNNTVNEGGTATYSIKVEGYIVAATDANTPTAAADIVITLANPTPDATAAATTGEAEDVSLNEGATATFQIPANTSTTSRVRFSDTKTIRVATLQDPDAEDEKFTLAFSEDDFGGLQTALTGGADIAMAATNPTSLTIKDNEVQTYKLALSPASQKPTEGTDITVALTAVPPHEDGFKTVSLSSDKDGTTGWSVSPDTARIGVPDGGGDPVNEATITIVNPGNDVNRVADSVTLRAHSGQLAAPVLEDSLTITVADNNALQAVTAKVVDKDGKVLDPQPDSVEEGKSVKIAVMPVDKDGKVTTANEDLEISLMPSGSADARDYRALAKITITSGLNSSNVVDLMAEVDEDVGMEMLMFDATVSGEKGNGTETSTSMGVLSLTITDATEKKIWPKAEEDAYPKIKEAMELMRPAKRA